MIIAFMGNDGSGKTTMAKEIVRIFEDLGFKAIYRHEYDYAILKFLFKIVGVEKIDKERKWMIVERKKSWKYYIWPFLVWFDILLQYLYFKIFRRKAIVVLDRYPYDHYMSFKYLGYLTSVSEWLYLHFPKPDVGILLWVNPYIAYNRKRSSHNYPITFYKKQTKNYFNLARRLQLFSISTDKPKKQTINEVLSVILEIKPEVLRKLIQNRIIFYFLKKYELKNGIFQRLWKEFRRRKERFRRSIQALKNLFTDIKIRDYALIKTFDEFGWIGNDIDVLISPLDFKKILGNKDAVNKTFVEEVRHNRWDIGKMDIFIKNGLKLDIHSYIGWRNVVFLNYMQILKENFIQKKRMFDEDCVIVKDEINSVIIAITHVFEKGFMTLDEYLFLRKYFNKRFLENSFPKLSELIDEYVSWLVKLLNRPPRDFPVFIPISVLFRSYLKLLVRWYPSSRIYKLKAFVRDLTMMIFWRIRYCMKNKLPFEVNI